MSFFIILPPSTFAIAVSLKCFMIYSSHLLLKELLLFHILFFYTETMLIWVIHTFKLFIWIFDVGYLISYSICISFHKHVNESGKLDNHVKCYRNLLTQEIQSAKIN